MRVIELRGARTNNLKQLDLDIRPGTLLVVTGPSGAGKSSLAFGTLYAEGQRRYVESFSAYARQFLERLARPDVDRLDPVPAAIAVDRRAPVKTSRSTVATLTELTDYAKQLWAAASTLICTHCGAPVVSHSPATAVQQVLDALPNERLVIAYPLPVRDAEDFIGVREALARDGYRRLMLDGQLRELDEVRPSDVVSAPVAKKPARKKLAPREDAPAPSLLHVVTDRTVASAEGRTRLTEALEAAFERGEGRAEVFTAAGSCNTVSSGLGCDACGATYKKPSPGLFSYNSPIGACERCRGFGRVIDVDWDKVFADTQKTLAQGAIRPWTGKSTSWERRLLERYCKRAGVPMDVPYAKLTKAQVTGLIEGDGGSWRTGFPGLRRWFQWMETRAYKMHVRVLLSRYRKYVECEACHGTRFKPEVTAYRLRGLTLPEFYASSVRDALAFLTPLAAEFGRDPSLAQILSECCLRLSTLDAVGLHYLTLDRAARTLSGGELQRVSLTSALGASLTGTLFVLDEPTVGLHPADVAALLPVVRQLARADNVVVVIESDEHFLREADRVIELGPGAGERGGEVVFDGTSSEYATRRAPVDLAFARQRSQLAILDAERPPATLQLHGASGNNLANVNLELPLRALSCVTGVSGSGKSSLVLDTLVPAVQRALGDGAAQALPFETLRGHQALKSVVFVDQAPLGRTSRGNPATYLGAWDLFRKHFAKQPRAVEREYTAGTFSFNVAGGRCEACKGEGAETVEMQFLSDVTFSCPQCGGRRFLGPVLDVELAGKNVAEVLELSATEAAQIFAAYPDIVRRLTPLIDVGAGYLRLGQALNTLSGGEAQRLKLAAALAEATRDALIVLDEPTAGLHALDTLPLVRTLRALVERGNTVVLVEHDMRVAAASDYVVDLGPGAGALGGRIVAAGTPAEVSRGDGKTAHALCAVLARLGDDAARPQSNARAALLPGIPLATAEGPAQQLRADMIAVRGAREHNLRELDLDVPRDQLVVVTGPSGSGKSTLAFDVIFAESQRRYLETLSPYVRQYLKQLPRPAVDRVIGAPPSISLEQRSTGGARNSTVATVTEVAHHLRVMFARAGRLHCPDCGLPIEARSVAALAAHARDQFGQSPVSVWAPIVRGRKGAHREALALAIRSGQKRARIDGELVTLERGMKLDRWKEHDVELDLGSARPGSAEFVALIEQCVARADGSVLLRSGKSELRLSTRRACPKCNTGYPELDPRFFSFNTRQGACPACDGQGEIEVDPTARKKRDVHERARGTRGDLARSERESRGAEPVRVLCKACNGQRLSGLALHTFLDGARITEFLSLDVSAAHARLKQVKLSGREGHVAAVPLREALLRLSFLERVGLEYLTLDRPAWSLSGGELQRVRLAAQLGSGLTGLLYVLDEPTIGLHPRDTDRLLRALRDLTAKGCSVLMVEHDAETIRAADHVIDVGPGGGHTGGRILAQGTPAELAKNPASLTFASLARPATLAERRRPVDRQRGVRLRGARAHNLRDVDLWIPNGRFVAVTGVSGSGKSTLVRDVFLRATRSALGLATDAPGAHRDLRGAEVWKSAIEIDQTPIGRTPRSVPATYVGVWNELRTLLATTPEARARGYAASRFSFNTKGGRCDLCEGQGATSFEMAFLPEALVVCEACDGMRFNPETLAVTLRGVNAGQILSLDVGEIAELFAAVPKVKRPLELLSRLGLSYLKLGQPSNTLSGGEAQRLKLVSELAARGAGPTLYVMDEPTTGLHREDVQRLLAVMQDLVDRGDTVLVIEHHPDVILAADWVVDMGPEGGAGGGTIVAQGTPEDIMREAKSHTGRVLRRELQQTRSSERQSVRHSCS